MSQIPFATSSAAPGAIGGALNFGNAVGPNDYMGAYQNALSLNQQNYGQILGGYQNLGQTQAKNQQAILQGYGNLYTGVLGGIQGIGASQAQAIRDAYGYQTGQTAQDMINRGLGNTTVQQSVLRGNLYDRMKAETGLANQMAQLQAGYQSQLGLAGLNYANQANQQGVALGSQQLGWLNSINSPYPNAAAYNQLAQQKGYASRANQLFGQMPRSMGMGGGIGGGGGGVAGARGGFGGLGGGAGGSGLMQQSAAGYAPGAGQRGEYGVVRDSGQQTISDEEQAARAAAAGYGNPSAEDYAAYLQDLQGTPGAPTAEDYAAMQGDGGTAGGEYYYESAPTQVQGDGYSGSTGYGTYGGQYGFGGNYSAFYGGGYSGY